MKRLDESCSGIDRVDIAPDAFRGYITARNLILDLGPISHLLGLALDHNNEKIAADAFLKVHI